MDSRAGKGGETDRRPRRNFVAVPPVSVSLAALLRMRDSAAVLAAGKVIKDSDGRARTRRGRGRNVSACDGKGLDGGSAVLGSRAQGVVASTKGVVNSIRRGLRDAKALLRLGYAAGSSGPAGMRCTAGDNRH